LEIFPKAKIINLVRPPEQMLPSTINLWDSNWKAYGSPGEDFPLQDVIEEYTQYWYSYPQDELGDLPEDKYSVVYFENLVTNPKKEVMRIYQQFGFEIDEEYLGILEKETINSRQYTSSNHYSLDHMGQSVPGIKQKYSSVMAKYPDKPSASEPIMKKIEG
jgi:hypothetical protein